MYRDIKTVGEWREFGSTARESGRMMGLFFYSEWHKPSMAVKELAEDLQEDFPSIMYASVNPDIVGEPATAFSIEAVPAVIVVRPQNNNQVVGRVTGGDVPAIVSMFESCAAKYPVVEKEEKTKASSLESRIRSLINMKPIMLFMKGKPEAPRCGFSRTIVGLLSQYTSDFAYFDILQDHDVRQGTKTLCNWPTYPMLFLKGELVGGLDVIKELHEGEELGDMIEEALGDSRNEIDTRLKALINQEKVMLFMKGSPDQPRCGFSNKTVSLLQSKGAKFGYFDILSDPLVRVELKRYSSWPTYPQLYVNGELIGGLDVLKELDDDGELEQLLKE